MALMKGDMSGAAVVLSTLYAITKLRLPINVVATIPLTENMPSGKATKPGDVVWAMGGKSVEVDNTDAEGRLALADAITYTCKTHTPHRLICLSTLTGAMDIALGPCFSGVFSSTNNLWEGLERAGKKSGDGVWRMPLWKGYRGMIDSGVADLKNVGPRSGGACTAAIFLREFVPHIIEDGAVDPDEDAESDGDAVEKKEKERKEDVGVEFAHIDIAGVMELKSGAGYLSPGMTGRPTRTMIEYVRELAAAAEAGEQKSL
ncbi:hypothetical protein HK102_004552 [Quaeritorhiza haematococci]|nr:hypothetical protein HK102_004552 [Quaeritorhiza haematococci]